MVVPYDVMRSSAFIVVFRIMIAMLDVLSLAWCLNWCVAVIVFCVSEITVVRWDFLNSRSCGLPSAGGR